MTAPTPCSSEEVSRFAWFWLAVAGSIGFVALLGLTFRFQILAFLKPFFPYIDVI